MSRSSVILIGVRVVMALAVIVAMPVILGIFFGWRLAVAVIVAYALFLLRVNTEPKQPGRLRTSIEFVIFGIVGTAVGAFALGALGGIFGCMVGISARLAEVPIMGMHPWSRRRSQP